jgi:hypothetical protein
MAEDRFEALARKEISATTRWGVGMMATILIQAAAIFFWAATLQAQTEQNAKDIAALQTKVESINDDIRNILVGIEQVKARLGIVEVEKL